MYSSHLQEQERWRKAACQLSRAKNRPPYLTLWPLRERSIEEGHRHPLAKQDHLWPYENSTLDLEKGQVEEQLHTQDLVLAQATTHDYRKYPSLITQETDKAHLQDILEIA